VLTHHCPICCKQRSRVWNDIDILPRLKSGDSYRVQPSITTKLNHLSGFLLLTAYAVHFTG